MVWVALRVAIRAISRARARNQVSLMVQSGGSLCTLAIAMGALAVIEIPLNAAPKMPLSQNVESPVVF